MATKDKKYIQAIGRRKTATAQVRVWPEGKNKITVNGKDFAEYFFTDELQGIVRDPFTRGKVEGDYEISIVVKGGGMHAQAEAARHGITRALVEQDEEQRVPLKRLGFLKRDPRKKERKKFGLKKARKSSQWSKR